MIAEVVFNNSHFIVTKTNDNAGFPFKLDKKFGHPDARNVRYDATKEEAIKAAEGLTKYYKSIGVKA